MCVCVCVCVCICVYSSYDYLCYLKRMCIFTLHTFAYSW